MPFYGSAELVGTSPGHVHDHGQSRTHPRFEVSPVVGVNTHSLPVASSFHLYSCGLLGAG